MYIKTSLILCSVLVLFTLAKPVFGQVLSTDYAIGIPITQKIQNGDIITSAANGYKLSTSPYDSQIFGVVSLNPAVYLRNKTAKNNIPVASAGDVLVRVSNLNGNINSGDFITSSTIPGVGEKATDNGYVLGRAEQSYSSDNPKKTGLVLTTLQPHFAQITDNITHNIFTAFTLGFNEAYNSPLGLLRYLIAGLITLFSFYFGFRFFARASNRGVEAIGRNPLAKQAILFSVLINTVITICIMFLGVAIAYLILVL